MKKPFDTLEPNHDGRYTVVVKFSLLTLKKYSSEFFQFIRRQV